MCLFGVPETNFLHFDPIFARYTIFGRFSPWQNFGSKRVLTWGTPLNVAAILENWYNVITLSRMVLFGGNSAGSMQSDMFAKAAWRALWKCRNWPPYVLRKQQILMKKSWQFKTYYKDDGSEIAELKQQISQKTILAYFAAHWHFGNMLGSNISFCDICCFSSATLMLWSL